jgi:hypothetical protein
MRPYSFAMTNSSFDINWSASASCPFCASQRGLSGNARRPRGSQANLQLNAPEERANIG